MTGTVVNIKNEIITAPLFLKFTVRDKVKGGGRNKGKKEGRKEKGRRCQ